MHVIHRYILDKCQSLMPMSGNKILDHGCGNGEMVEAGLNAGLSMYGVDLFDTSNSRQVVIEKGLYGDVVRRIKDNRIPFPDDYFDLVVSNQVFEYVFDLQEVLEEIKRVLKPDGKLLCLFPTREVVRDGRCGVPCIHWFSSGDNTYRQYWMVLMHQLGFGCRNGYKTTRQWIKDHLEYIDNYTFYRGYGDIKRMLLENFTAFHHIENDYISYRLEQKRMSAWRTIVNVPPFTLLAKWLYRRLAGVVILAVK